MKKTLILIFIVTTLIGCTQSPNCEQSKKYVNQFGKFHRELSKNNIEDSLYASLIDFTRLYVTDSMEQDPRCFQYNFNVDLKDKQLFSVVELYDKRLEISEKSPFNDSIYYRLNNIRDLYFDSTGTYQYNMWVADTEEEMEESERMFKKYFKSK